MQVSTETHSTETQLFSSSRKLLVMLLSFVVSVTFNSDFQAPVLGFTRKYRVRFMSVMFQDKLLKDGTLLMVSPNLFFRVISKLQHQLLYVSTEKNSAGMVAHVPAHILYTYNLQIDKNFSPKHQRLSPPQQSPQTSPRRQLVLQPPPPPPSPLPVLVRVAQWRS